MVKLDFFGHMKPRKIFKRRMRLIKDWELTQELKLFFWDTQDSHETLEDMLYRRAAERTHFIDE